MPSADQWKKALQSSACDETLCREATIPTTSTGGCWRLQ